MSDVWKTPPLIKVYEALGAVADGRIEETSESTATVSSSSGNKNYDVSIDISIGSIMTNDNGSYWQGYLGYPAIAYLMHKGLLHYKSSHAEALKSVPWKDWNQKNKNDFEQTLVQVNDLVKERGVDPDELKNGCEEILAQLESLKLTKLGKRQKPPTGY